MNRVFICEHLELKNPNNKRQNWTHVVSTSVNRFCGETISGSLTSLLQNAFNNTLTETHIQGLLTEILGATDLNQLHARCFNTLDIDSEHKDCRYRLRCASSFHQREQRSGLSLSESKMVDGNFYLYGECMLFLTVGVMDLVICRMYKTISLEIGCEDGNLNKYFEKREVFDSIFKNYALLSGNHGSSKVFVVSVDDVRRQEQLLRVNNDIVLVNHFCHSNIFYGSMAQKPPLSGAWDPFIKLHFFALGIFIFEQYY